jgi:hypothetical protein
VEGDRVAVEWQDDCLSLLIYVYLEKMSTEELLRIDILTRLSSTALGSCSSRL